MIRLAEKVQAVREKGASVFNSIILSTAKPVGIMPKVQRLTRMGSGGKD
jgi:hypothetical protein